MSTISQQPTTPRTRRTIEIMPRAKPVETVHQTYGAHYDQLCVMASRYWRRNVLPDGESVIFVDLLMQDVRVGLRSLTLANAIRRVTPARIVALVGPDPDWNDVIWQYYDVDRLAALAVGYGATDVVNVSELVGQFLADGGSTVEIAGTTITLPAESSIPRHLFDDIVEATAVRVLRVPEVDNGVRSLPMYARVAERSVHYARLYEAIFTQVPTTAFITSHIDYAQWGLAVDAAMRADVPVVHVQSTGGLKAYALFPDKVEGAGTYRMQMTRLISDYFEQHVWRHREVLRRSAELTTWRSKVNLGRPSWWRGGGAVSQLEFRTRSERRAVRDHATRRFGWNPDRPVIAVFNHAVSDAVKSNFEIFDNLADWFEQTVEFAAAHPEVNWLLVDHPAQAFYDGTQRFEQLAERHAEHPHMVFRGSMQLSKNVIWSLVDLAVTVRGSVSNEYPAYGIPALQAGWSEWSHCGFSQRADTQEQYWTYLNDAIRGLLAGESLITAEEVERARLWLWYYRCASDVVTPLCPHWESSQKDRLYMSVKLALSHVESEGDPAFVTARRMWLRREPFLTRSDLTRSSKDLVHDLGLVELPAAAPVTHEVSA